MSSVNIKDSWCIYGLFLVLLNMTWCSFRKLWSRYSQKGPEGLQKAKMAAARTLKTGFYKPTLWRLHLYFIRSVWLLYLPRGTPTVWTSCSIEGTLDLSQNKWCFMEQLSWNWSEMILTAQSPGWKSWCLIATSPISLYFYTNTW